MSSGSGSYCYELVFPEMASTPVRPGVVLWAKLYLGALSALYFVLLLFAPFMMASGDEEAFIYGIVFFVIGLPCAILSLVPIFLPPKPWVWVWILVEIAFGMTSVCCLPIAVPLLIFWIKPETKRYYGKVNV